MNEQLTNADLTAVIYVQSNLDRESLVDRIASGVSGHRDGWRIDAAWGSLHSRRNKNADAIKATEGHDSFLYFPFIFDLDPNKSISSQDYVAGVSQLLEFCWQHVGAAVAACAFEEELPHQGGIKLLE